MLRAAGDANTASEVVPLGAMIVAAETLSFDDEALASTWR